MNFARVIEISADGDTVWVEFENGNAFPIPADHALDEFEVGDLVFVTEEMIRRAPAAAVWKKPLQVIGRLVSMTDDRVMLRVDRAPRIEELAAIEDPEIDAYYFLDNDGRVWRRLTDAEAGAAEGAEGIDFTVNRFEVENLTPARGGRAQYGGMTDWFGRLLVAVTDNFAARAAADGRDYTSGAILFGPPGTGKTFLARSIAEEASASLITVNGPELVDRWFGSTEPAMRDLFETGRQHPRSIIFIDEFDSIGPKRGPDVHEAINRQVGQLLSLTDSANRADRPFVIAATNRLEDVDPGFLRAGRFDYKIPFTLPRMDERVRVVRAQAPELAPEVVQWIAAATDGLSPAELAQVWREADHRRDRDGRIDRTLEDILAGLAVVKFEHATVALAREEWEREKEKA
ncbi:MAG: ATPase [Schumannella sp.]|nr:ATPase [Schumannella sp.]